MFKKKRKNSKSMNFRNKNRKITHSNRRNSKLIYYFKK